MSIGTKITEVAIAVTELSNSMRRSAAKKEVRRTLRRTIGKIIQVKQFEDTAGEMEKALEPFFKRQVDSAAKNLMSMETRSLDSKDVSSGALALTDLIFDPDAWFKELIDISLPVLAKSMAEAATFTILSMGLDVRKQTIQQNIKSVLKIKQSTASEWLESSDEDLPVGLIFDTPDGPVRIGITTEFPHWMRVAISRQLKETFSESYWEDINLTTRNDIARILDSGLKDGLSIRSLAKKITRELGSAYDKIRATKVARTEAGNALNAGRNLGIDQLRIEVGPVLGQHIGKEWLSVLAADTRDSHAGLDGTLSNSEGLFNLGGVMIPWPSHQSLPARNRVNCLCTILTAFGINAPEEEILALLESKTWYEQTEKSNILTR